MPEEMFPVVEKDAIKIITEYDGASPEEVEKQVVALQQAADMVSRLNQRVPYVTGEKTLLGNMPDWNPAEMIGLKPNPLAISLYKEISSDFSF